MPFYLYQHPVTQQVVEVKQKISDTHEYTDEKGVKWNRVFTVPHASIPSLTRVQAGSEEDFIRKTRSDQRKNERGDGKDPVQEKFYKDYSKKRKGLKHLDDPSGKSSNSDGVIEV